MSTADVLNKLFGNVSMSSTFDALDQDTGCELLTSVFCLVTIGFKSGNSKSSSEISNDKGIGAIFITKQYLKSSSSSKKVLLCIICSGVCSLLDKMVVL